MRDAPFVRLPDKLVLDLREVAMLLFALDTAEDQSALDSAAQAQITAARRLLTSKLWPELGNLLDDGDEG